MLKVLNSGYRKASINEYQTDLDNPGGGEELLTEPIIRLLKDKNFAFLATKMNDGTPHVAPTWIDLENDLILINTAEGRIKHKNILRDPRVSISMVDRNNPYSMVTIQGTVVEMTNEGADAHIDKLAKKYLNINKYPSHSPLRKRIIFKIKTEKVFFLPPRYTEYLDK
jgi:PPOX class probable F420-dependent enzyme